MKKDQKFIYNRSLSIGDYMVVADIVGPFPHSEQELTNENVDIIISCWLMDRTRPKYYRTGVPCVQASSSQFITIEKYLHSEGFIEHLSQMFREDWETLKAIASEIPEEKLNEIEDFNDAENRNWVYDTEKKELFASAAESGNPADGYEASDDNNIF